MKLYTENDIEYCVKRVFGKVNMFDKYEPKLYKNVLTNQKYIKIVGIDKIEKDCIYMQVNEFDFLKETKKIGRQLYEVLFKDLLPLVEYNDPYFLVNSSIVKNDSLNNKYKKILEILTPFFKKYGMPIDYSSFCSSNSKYTNSIDLNNICTIFLLIHIISDLAFHYNKGCHIEQYYKILGIDLKVSHNRLMDELLNPSIFIKMQLGIFNLKFERLYPVYYTNNLFSFAYERLKLNIIERKNDNNILVRTCECRNPIIESNEKGKNARASSKCDECVIKDKREYNKNKSKKSYNSIADSFRELKKIAREIEESEFKNEYSNLLKEIKQIKKIKDFKVKKHSGLYKEIKQACEKLKSN